MLPPRLPLFVAALLAAAACAPIEVPLRQTYQGPVVTAPSAGAPVALALDFRDQNKASFPGDAMVVSQYRRLAGSALTQAGYVLDPAASTAVSVSLQGETPNGIVDNRNNTARNIAVGVATLGIACKEMEHQVAASGTVSIRREGAPAQTLDLPMRATSTSCHSTLNPSWLENHMKAAVATYENAASAHIAAWLPALAAAGE
jgi:hypothetical protein